MLRTRDLHYFLPQQSKKKRARTHRTNAHTVAAVCFVVSDLVRLCDLLLDRSDGFAGVQALGAGFGAVHDCVAAEEFEGVI